MSFTAARARSRSRTGIHEAPRRAGDGRAHPCACVLVSLLVAVCSSTARAAVYEVGPGHALTNLGDVPWESLAAGDEVRIHARPTPYAEKFVICAQGTESAPVVIRGIPGPGGELPVIRGENATTRPATNYWNEARGIVKIGGANAPSCTTPTWIVLENLAIGGARATQTFTGRDGTTGYEENAAAVFVEVAQHLVLRNLELTDSGNGLFVAASDGETEDVLVQGCTIRGNGNVGSIFEHNSYTAARGIVFEGNRYGPLCDGCLGNNLKDRSAGLVVRYNVLEGGNRQLDLVDAEDSAALQDDPRYRRTFVYGNVLVEPDGAGNSQIVHYGGDSGDPSIYRKGTLYFHHNTVVSTRSGNTTLFRLSTDAESVDARNNVVHVTAGGDRLALVDGSGDASLVANFLTTGYVASHGTVTGTIDVRETLDGSEPGFVDLAGGDFRLAAGSPCIDRGVALAAAASPAHRVVYQPSEPSGLEARPDEAPPDLGAFERCVSGSCPATNPDAGIGGGEAPQGSGCGCTVAGRAHDSGGRVLFGVALASLGVLVRPRRRRTTP